ncbi:MAG: FAD:protein FMN transferase, partial [Cyclobacteriaceae bacterium]|nr:FAD:protein FMN transferase [Cyclobacteriaceae bacterium]
MSKLLLVYFLLLSNIASAQPKTSTKVISLMGSRFELVAISADESIRKKSIEAAIDEITSIENLISSWKQNSEASQINIKAGIEPVRVSAELFNLIERAKKISNLTN